MTTLKNFIRNEDTLECDFFPENDERCKCHIVISKEDEEIVSVTIPDTIPPGVEKCTTMDIGGARTILAKYVDGREFPEVDYYISH